MSFKIIIGADIVPTQSNIELFATADREQLLGVELSKNLNMADFIIMNLETPLVDKQSPIAKCGPNLKAPKKTIVGLKNINPFFYTLANNHILDQGQDGLKSTIELLKNNGIQFAGAGRNISEAKKPYILTIDNLKIGIYCCAEHEFTIADEDMPGANPFDVLESFDHVASLRKTCDYVIVLYHGGKENYRYPSPFLQKVCRKFVDKGANLVVCQHSHCIGCQESWNDGTIVYGQGNFLFDNSDSDFWKTSLLIEMIFDGTNTKINWIPLIKKANVVNIAVGEDSNSILTNFEKRSLQIKSYDFVRKEYEKFSKSMLDTYYFKLLGKVSSFILFHAFNKLCGHRLTRHIYSGQQKLNVLNVIECEAHRELIICGLKKSK